MPLHLITSDIGVTVQAYSATTVTGSGASTQVAVFTGTSTTAGYAGMTYVTGTGQLALSTTGSGAGILIGGDFQIYRSAADVGYTPDSFQVNANLGVGVAPSTSYKAYAAQTVADGVTNYAVYATNIASNTATTGGFPGVAGISFQWSGGSASLNYGVGVLCDATVVSSQTGGTATSLLGGNFRAYFDGRGAAVTNFYGGQFTAYAATSGATGTIATNSAGIFNTTHNTSSTVAVTNNYGVYVAQSCPSGGITFNYGVRITAPTTGAGVIANDVGLYIDDRTVGSNIYAVNFAGTSGLARQGIWWNKDTNLYRSAASVLATDDKLYVALELEVDGALNHDGTTVGFYGVTPVVRSSAYTPTNVTTDRAYDANATSVDELADVLGTLIADLKLTGIIA